jgi:hypothetical protein
MFTAAFCFLGIAALIVAALVCLWKARQTNPVVEVDLGGLHAASICISSGRRGGGGPATAGDREPTAAEKAKWREMKEVWMDWYIQCVEKAATKQKTLYSWARTLALCAALSLVGVVLEVHYGESVSLSGILAGFQRPRAAAAEAPAASEAPQAARSAAPSQLTVGPRRTPPAGR